MKNKNGFVILEALLAIVVLTMVVLSVVPMLSYLLKRTAKSRYEPQAALLLQEAIEISYNIFVSDWDAYPIDSIYHPGKSANGKWVLFNGSQDKIETIYNRSIEIKRACRNANGDIVDAIGNCTGVKDNDSRIVNAKVTWDDSGVTKEISGQLLLVNLEN